MSELKSISPALDLQNILDDIVNNVEIRPDFSIVHPSYKPLEIAEEAKESFLNLLPATVQQKYLSMQLRGFLYGIYYNGSLRQALALDAENNELPKDLENNTILGIDIAFYEQLHENNQGLGYFDPGWQVLREESDGAIAVTKGGLRLHIEREKHLLDSQKNVKIGDTVVIKLPKNRVQNGFYMAVGNEGFSRAERTDTTNTTVRIYWNFTPDGALVVMKELTEQLNSNQIPFSFKVLYNPKEYQRDDAGVLYFDKQDYSQIKPIIMSLYEVNQGDFKQEIPLFTLLLAEGLGLAEEPNHRFSEQESFGTHRCQIIANALLHCWYEGDNSPPTRMKEIASQFEALGIDLNRVYLNANSEDIYQL
jgi:hypothetical protein